VAKYLYDPFGNTLSMSGPLASANTYRFSSKEWNANSGLYYYLYRLYDPNLQRWPNRDPITDLGFDTYESLKNNRFPSRSWPVYQYVLNDPTKYYDAFGLFDSGGSGTVMEPPNLPPGSGGGDGGGGADCAALAEAATEAFEALSQDQNNINLQVAALMAAQEFEAAGCGQDIAPPPKLCPPNEPDPAPPSRLHRIFRTILRIIDTIPVIITPPIQIMCPECLPPGDPGRMA
jgi:RHS repeat-associated protein